MSANNTIYVRKIAGIYYLCEGSMDIDPDVQDFLKENIAYTSRGEALCAAHDLDRKLGTEYGPTEIDE